MKGRGIQILIISALILVMIGLVLLLLWSITGIHRGVSVVPIT